MSAGPVLVFLALLRKDFLFAPNSNRWAFLEYDFQVGSLVIITFSYLFPTRWHFLTKISIIVDEGWGDYRLCFHLIKELFWARLKIVQLSLLKNFHAFAASSEQPVPRPLAIFHRPPTWGSKNLFKTHFSNGFTLKWKFSNCVKNLMNSLEKNTSVIFEVPHQLVSTLQNR